MDRLLPRRPAVLGPGAVHLPGWLDPPDRRRLGDACSAWGEAAGGFRSPRMPNGSTMSVELVCLGWHWYPYRYVRDQEDGDGRPVLPFPGWLGDLAREAVVDAAAVDRSLAGGGSTFAPDVALVNWYRAGAKMGMHADADERSPAPVVSFSLGQTGIFRFGTPATRGRPWRDTPLESGDAVVFGGASRLAYHGVPRLVAGTGDPELGNLSGRMNVTVRETGLTDGAGADPKARSPGVGGRRLR